MGDLPHDDLAMFTCTGTQNAEATYEGLLADIQTILQGPIDALKEILAERHGINFETHMVVLPESMCEQMGLPVPLTTLDILSSPFLEDTKFWALQRSDLLRKLGDMPQARMSDG